MAHRKPLQVGEWVRLRGAPVGLTLRSDRGLLARRIGEDNWIVHLVLPATYHRADGSTEVLSEILEYGDNLIRLLRKESTHVSVERAGLSAC